MWQQAVWDVIQQDLDETGAMIHISTEEVDEGPVLSTTRFSVKTPDLQSMWSDLSGKDVSTLPEADGEDLPLFKAIREAGLLRERPLLIETLKAVSSGRIDPSGNGDVVDLSDEVEAVVARG